MKILANVHLYPPDHCAGAEMMLHEILLGMQERGHDVQVVVNESSAIGFEGVPIEQRDEVSVRDLIQWSDIVITHLDRTRDTVRAVSHSRPLVHLVHNHLQLQAARVQPRDAALVVANSQWIKNKIKWRGDVIVVPPPVRPERYAVRHSGMQAITLVNMMADKGANTFWSLARLMPERRFIGVLGGYGVQIVPDDPPPNVDVFAHTSNINNVYRQTRILLAPSYYESWGRVGIEAAASGIPTIAHPTPGLLESLRGAGTFVDRDDIDGWAAEIRLLDQHAVYEGRRIAALARSAELDPDPHIDRLEAAMLKHVKTEEMSDANG